MPINWRESVKITSACQRRTLLKNTNLALPQNQLATISGNVSAPADSRDTTKTGIGEPMGTRGPIPVPMSGPIFVSSKALAHWWSHQRAYYIYICVCIHVCERFASGPKFAMLISRFWTKLMTSFWTNIMLNLFWKWFQGLFGHSVIKCSWFLLIVLSHFWKLVFFFAGCKQKGSRKLQALGKMRNMSSSFSLKTL